MSTLKTLIVGIVAVISKMFLAPKYWPAHQIAFTVIAVVVTSLIVGMVLPGPKSEAPKPAN